MGFFNVILKRRNWDTLLAEELRKPRLFAWGSNDCCLFVGDVLKAMTGLDPAKAFRGRYTTARGAYKELKSRGFSDVNDLANKMATILGFKKVDINFARTGDIVSVKIDGRISLGVVQREYGVFVGSSGYVYVNKTDVITAWAVE